MVRTLWPFQWNGGKLFDSLASSLGWTVGFCNICGHLTKFDTTNSNHREHVVCARCGSRNRQRQIAFFLLRCMGLSSPFACIARLNSEKLVWISEATSSLSVHLKQSLQKRCVISEFIDPEVPSGKIVNNILHIDMCNTHFTNDSLDFILSGDVLEHMPDFLAALQETYRILKVGGCHIFTVPFYQHRFTVEKRAACTDGNTITHFRKPWMHYDPIRPEGILVYNVFALELLCELEKIGFDVRMEHIFSPWHGIYGPNGLVIIATKSASPVTKTDIIFSS